MPVALALAAIAWPARGWKPSIPFWRGANPGVRTAQALNIWIIQAVVAIGPPVGALIFGIYLKTDWGISLFFLTPLALIAIPTLRLRQLVLFRIAAIYLVITLAVLVASPRIVAFETNQQSDDNATYRSRSDLARQLTEEWRARFHSRWPVVAAYTDTGEPMAFYSPDHPAPLTPNELWSSGLTSLEEARRLGFIGICEPNHWKFEACEAWMKENAAGGERMVVTTRRFFHGSALAPAAWNVVIVPGREAAKRE